MNINLTTEELSTLICYILQTTKWREGEAEAWAELAQEKKEDGTPKYKHARSNAQYWRDMEKTLSEIKGKLEEAEL